MAIIVDSEKAVQKFYFSKVGIEIIIRWKFKKTVLCDFFAD